VPVRKRVLVAQAGHIATHYKARTTGVNINISTWEGFLKRARCELIPLPGTMKKPGQRGVLLPYVRYCRGHARHICSQIFAVGTCTIVGACRLQRVIGYASAVIVN
jgi:hypothetical protein